MVHMVQGIWNLGEQLSRQFRQLLAVDDMLNLALTAFPESRVLRA